jgi:UDP-N-acetylglucosamine 2-epimerase (non-hydrolysing)
MRPHAPTGRATRRPRMLGATSPTRDPSRCYCHARVAEVVVVLGTRPEAIKLAPVVHAARTHGDWTVRVVDSGQHLDLLPPVLATVGLAADEQLSVMRAGQPLSHLLAALLRSLDDRLAARPPDLVVGQGDTTTALAAGLAAFHRGIAFAHVEAGLRTHDLRAPFPEEANRALVARVAALHLAPSVRAVENLRAEGIAPAAIELVGNTVVDALRAVAATLPPDGSPPADAPADLRRLPAQAPLVLVTGHRRESFDGGLAVVCGAIAELARLRPHVHVVYPVHANPHVRATVDATLQGLANVHVIPPVPYTTSAWLLRRCRFAITDSGGLQEEAPEFGKPVLVTRTATERPEAVDLGAAEIVGYDRARLLERALAWIDDEAAYARVVPSRNPFGDGRAGARCVAAMRRRLGLPAAVLPAWP